MSSLSKSEFVVELKLRSPVIRSFTDSDVGDFVDISLRYFSGKRPGKKVSLDNAVVEGQELYDFPSDATSVYGLRVSESLEQIAFGIEDIGAGRQIRPGVIKTRSTRDLMTPDYYIDPVSYQVAFAVTGYENFDILYNGVHDMDSIEERWLDALAYYTEYLANNSKAETGILATEANAGEEITELSDSDSSGASTSLTFLSSADSKDSYIERADKALEKYEGLTKTSPFGVRG